jgi:hypothetical protein
MKNLAESLKNVMGSMAHKESETTRLTAGSLTGQEVILSEKHQRNKYEMPKKMALTNEDEYNENLNSSTNKKHRKIASPLNRGSSPYF